MASRQALIAALGAVSVVVLGMAVPVTASPAPVSACPPCGEGFLQGAANHGLDTDVRRGEATVRVHGNGSATWAVRVVPTNESVLRSLEENGSLARAVATDSFGTRYGSGIEHEFVSADVADGAFVMRYRTLDVVREGPFGTAILTYFRDAPGAYVYTDLGADELTVVAPPEMTVARGFGDVTDRRLTATELPPVRDGPFVVFAPPGSPVPGVVGALAVIEALAGVVARNVVFFVALPGAVLVGGLAGIRWLFDPTRNWNPRRLGGLVAIGGASLLVGAVVSEADVFPAVTGNLLVGGVGGAILLGLGVSVAVSTIRRHLTPLRLVGAGLVVAVLAAAVAETTLGTSSFHRSIATIAALLPAAVGLGWLDARGPSRDRPVERRLFVGIAVAVFAVLVASAPLTALGGSLFLLVPLLLTAAAVGVVVAAIPLYLLGAAAAGAESN